MTTDALQAEITEAIKKNMPQQVGDQLQQLLADAKSDKKALADSRQTIDRLNGQVSSLQEQIRAQNELDAQSASIKTKEEDLAARELQLRTDTAMNRALVAEAKADTALKMFGIVFQNRTLRESVVGQTAVAVPHTPPSNYNPNGNPAYISPQPTHETRTLEEDPASATPRA